ncbi:restriction endonuclease subunit S [Lyngbya aestuarii]|uniref:restriction endonuclease subunit S n=1 Tax=Lyngbya aestuarii TaxID=118322 RepID=UPI00403D610D
MTEENYMEVLDKYFDTAFAAPDGVKRLRELILSLAMQGKLVQQDASDQPARELLKEIEAEKERLVKEGKIKKSKPLPEITPDEIPYEIPESWEWMQLMDISIRIHYGYTASANHELRDIRLLRITDIQNNKVKWDSVPGCDTNGQDVSSYLLANNDILIARTGGTVGKSYLVENININAVFASYLIRLIPSKHINVNYLKLVIESPLYWKQLYEKCSGTGQPNVNGTSLSTLLFPLPPLPEQRRIVEKIDRLMSRCDELERLRDKRNQKRLIVHAAACDRLLNAKDDQGFRKAWDFIRHNFSDLYSVKENVSELRKAILQLAVMGKLVPQNPDDPPASELLKEIEAEKKRLIKEGKIKKSKPLPEITPDEIPYDLPDAWEWTNIQNISLKVTDGEHKTPIRSDTGYYLLSARNVTNKGIKLDDVDYVLEEEYLRIRKRCNPEIGDILVSCSGSVGRIAIVDSDCYVMVRSVALIKYDHNRVSSSFLAYVLRSLLVQFQIVEKSRTTAQSNLFLGKIKELVIPLPPLPEQHRIVAKVDKLMTLCDQLEQQIDCATDKQTTLLNAVASHFINAADKSDALEENNRRAC